MARSAATRCWSGGASLFGFGLLCFAVTPLRASLSPATVNDSYGNSADNSSTITWAALPNGTAYNTSSSYDAGSLALLYKTATQFVSVCFPGATPWSLVMGLYKGTTSFSVDTIMNLVKWAYGYAAAIAIGVLFFIFFPLVGMCFCCCRTCCKKCGGKMEQERKGSYKAWRCCYVISIAICAAFLGSGMVCTYYTNQIMGTSINNVGTIIQSNLNDLDSYLSNTVMQVKYTAKQGFNFTSAVICRDLDNVGSLVGDPVHQQFSALGISAAFDALLSMDGVLSTMVTSLMNVKNTTTTVNVTVEALKAALAVLRSNLTSDCNAAPANACNATGIYPSLLTMNFDPSSIPNFDTQLTQLKNVQAQNITSLVLNGRNQFDNISNIVADKAGPTMTDLKGKLSSFSSTIDSQLSSITGMLSSVGNLSTYGAQVDEYVKMAAKYEQYRWYAGVGLTCTVLLVLVLLVLGLVFGCCGCMADSGKPPTKRGACGNCGGACLMASVGFSFIFGWLLILLVLITFIIGAPLNKIVCQSVRDPDLTFLKEIVDGGPGKSSLLPTTTTNGYPLGQMLFKNDSINLTASGLLQSCKNGASAWNALKLSALINIDAITNYKSQIDVNQSINGMNVDLSSLTILDSNTASQMSTMASSIAQINFAGIIAELNKTTVQADLNTLADKLDNNSNVNGNFHTRANTARNIQNNQVTAVQQAQASMLTSVTSLSQVAASVPGNITNLLALLNTTQTQIQTTGVTVVKQASLTFANRIIATADQFVTFALNSLQSDIGKCTPVWTLYSSMFDTAICGYFVDILDAFWFSLGWCVAFFVPSMIFATKFAKHVRRMSSLHHDDPDHGGSSERGRSSRTSIRHHKVHPE